jgi:hypothetical protein
MLWLGIILSATINVACVLLLLFGSTNNNQEDAYMPGKVWGGMICSIIAVAGFFSHIFSSGNTSAIFCMSGSLCSAAFFLWGFISNALIRRKETYA